MNRSLIHLLARVAFALLLAGCSSHEDMAKRLVPVTQQSDAQKRQLAYEHSVDIDTAPDRLAAVHAAGVAACREAARACTLLASRIDSEPEPSATLKFRARPELIPRLVAALGKQGDVARQSTQAEDLSGPIADSARELAMLDDYRSRLESLRSRAGNDVDALIKVNHELAEVQSRYETAAGKRALLAQRVETEILDVSIGTGRYKPFWTPIRRALADFGGNLAQGIALAVSGLAYLLPWLLMLAAAAWAARALWRRRRQRRHEGTAGGALPPS